MNNIDILSLSKTYKNYKEELKNKFVPDEDLSNNVFRTYASMLKKGISNESFIKHIFDNGFCELPLDLIQAFIQEEDMQWGGTWNSSNVDYMHFEVKQQKIAKYLGQKKPVKK